MRSDHQGFQATIFAAALITLAVPLAARAEGLALETDKAAPVHERVDGAVQVEMEFDRTPAPVVAPAAITAPAAAKLDFPPAPAETLPEGCIQEPGYPSGARLATVRFAVNEDVLSDEAKSILKPIAEVLAAEPQARIEISAYSDPSGSEAANRNLTEQRARAVESLFLSMHVAKAQLAVRAASQSHPRCPSALAEQRAADRRADIVLEGK